VKEGEEEPKEIEFAEEEFKMPEFTELSSAEKAAEIFVH